MKNFVIKKEGIVKEELNINHKILFIFEIYTNLY
jgi:hypothetical protein